MFQKIILAIVLISIGVAIGCVSVKLPGDSAATKSTAVSFKAPAHPFAQMNAKGADQAWQNSSNGNTISFYSSCNPEGPSDLETAERELETEFADVKTLARDKRRFNQREAVFSELEGQIEGVITRMSSVVFRKNGCTYSLTYIGIKKSFEQNKNQFQEFLQSFSAP